MRQLGEVLGQLVFRVAPREIGIRLREAELGQPMHDLGSRERLGEEDHIGMLRANRRDRPFPERERLRVRIVDAKNAHALFDPILEHAFELAP